MYQALDSPIAGVTSLSEDGGRSSAAIDDSVFEIPPGHTFANNPVFWYFLFQTLIEKKRALVLDLK